MATFYGGWVGGDDWYARLDATVENTSSTTCTVRLVGYIYNVYATASYFTADITTNASGGTTNYSVGSIWEGSGLKRINSSDITFTVSRGTSAKSVYVKNVIYGSGAYSGSSSTAGGYVTIPAIPTEKPNAPSSCSASRASDSSASVTWENGSTDTTHPRTATLVERDVDGGGFAQIASAASTASNYTDNGIEPNHRYQYRVRAQNSAGYSAYATSGYIYTTPAAPSSVALDKTAATTVQVDAAADAPYATGYDVERTYDGGSTWESVAENTALPITDSVGGGTVQYRVRSVRGSLASAWTLSPSLVTITPPLAPTITAAPANPSASGSAATVSWTPNHPDGTAQESAQVLVTSPSGASTTYTVTTATIYTFTPNATGTWTAQVRTKGLDASYGAWSDAVSWGVYNPPSVTITSPASDGATVTALPMSVAWTVADATGVSAQRIIVTDLAGNEVYNSTVQPSARSVSLTASDISLVNGDGYAIRLRVMGGSGLVSEQLRTFEVAWTPPAVPVLSISEGEGGSASIQVFYGEGTPATVSVDLMRVNADGTTWLMASGMADGDTAVDPLPPLGVQVEYRAVATAQSGATSAASYSQTFGGTDWVLNFGNAAQESVELKYNPDMSWSLTTGGESYHFADGGAGGGLPVWYPTTDVDESGTWKFDTVGPSTIDRISALCRRYGTAWMRDPHGRRVKAHVKPGASHGMGRVFGISLQWDAVRWTEAWDG